MKKATVTVSYDEDKLDALKRYSERKGIDVEDELVKSIDTLYARNVPSAVNRCRSEHGRTKHGIGHVHGTFKVERLS